jgi:hypothetical protein
VNSESESGAPNVEVPQVGGRAPSPAAWWILALRGEVEVGGWCVFEDAVGPLGHEGDSVGVPVQLQVLRWT